MNSMKRNEPHPPYSPQKDYFLGNEAENAGFGEKIFFWQGVFGVLTFILIHSVHILTPRMMDDLGKAKNMNSMNIYAVLYFKEIYSRMTITEKKFMKKKWAEKRENFIGFINIKPVNAVGWLVLVWIVEWLLALAALVWWMKGA